MAQLYGLDALGAVRWPNDDFHLALPLDRQQSPQERQEAAQVAQHRHEINDTYHLFEQWQGDMIGRLNACFRLAHETLKSLETPADLDKLTDAQTLAIREQSRVEWLADVLTSGDMEQMMDVFRQKEGVRRLCNQVLSDMRTKSGAA